MRAEAVRISERVSLLSLATELKGRLWARPFLCLCVVTAVGLFSLLAVGAFSLFSGNDSPRAMTEAERRVYIESLRPLVAEDPSVLAHLFAFDIAGLFGPPDFEREDAPAVLWQYRSASCVFDLYFQIGEKGDLATSAVAYHEVRFQDALPEDAHTAARQCFSEIMARTADPQASGTQLAYSIGIE